MHYNTFIVIMFFHRFHKVGRSGTLIKLGRSGTLIKVGRSGTPLKWAFLVWAVMTLYLGQWCLC